MQQNRTNCSMQVGQESLAYLEGSITARKYSTLPAWETARGALSLVQKAGRRLDDSFILATHSLEIQNDLRSTRLGYTNQNRTFVWSSGGGFIVIDLALLQTAHTGEADAGSATVGGVKSLLFGKL